MRITFHFGEDEVPRFEIASHVSGARPGVRAQGGGVAVRTVRGCGREDGSRGSRGGGRGRMPRGVPTRLPGLRALRIWSLTWNMELNLTCHIRATCNNLFLFP